MESPVRRIGRYGSQVAVETDSLLADRSLVNWAPAGITARAIRWSTTAPAPNPERYRRRFRERMLTLERLLQAHSGRLFGTPGVVAVDAAAVLLAFLSVGGLIMWWRIVRRR